MATTLAPPSPVTIPSPSPSPSSVRTPRLASHRPVVALRSAGRRLTTVCTVPRNNALHVREAT